jgi:hypothetical protein
MTNKTAIARMVEAIEYEMTLIPPSCAQYRAEFQRMLDKARRLQAEEQAPVASGLRGGMDLPDSIFKWAVECDIAPSALDALAKVYPTPPVAEKVYTPRVQAEKVDGLVEELREFSLDYGHMMWEVCQKRLDEILSRHTNDKGEKV